MTHLASGVIVPAQAAGGLGAGAPRPARTNGVASFSNVQITARPFAESTAAPNVQTVTLKSPASRDLVHGTRLLPIPTGCRHFKPMDIPTAWPDATRVERSRGASREPVLRAQ
jgi:hypothetical protein